MMKHRAALFSNEISNLAEAMYDDLSFRSNLKITMKLVHT